MSRGRSLSAVRTVDGNERFVVVGGRIVTGERVVAEGGWSA